MTNICIIVTFSSSNRHFVFVFVLLRAYISYQLPYKRLAGWVLLVTAPIGDFQGFWPDLRVGGADFRKLPGKPHSFGYISASFLLFCGIIT